MSTRPFPRLSAALVLLLPVLAVGLVSSAAEKPVRAEFGIPSTGNASTIAAMKKFSVGNFSTCVLRPDGHPVCWGLDANNSFGTGWKSQDKRGDSPSDMGGFLPRTVATSATPGFYLPVQAVFSGGDQTCVLTLTSALRCVGTADGGALGRSDGLVTTVSNQYSQLLDDSSTIDLGVGRTVVDLAPGGDSSGNNGGPFNCALLDNGSVKCWGNNSVGQLGLGDTVNRGASPGQMGDNLPAVDLGSGVTASAISAGQDFACAIVGGGTVPAGSIKCWGKNGFGQLGLGDKNNRGDGPDEMGDDLPVVDIGVGRTAKAITTGFFYACAIRDDDSVVCWGSNFSGELGANRAAWAHAGDGSNEMGANLVAVNLGAGRTARQLSAGHSTTCALLDNGDVKCWGNNATGQLGLGDTDSRGNSVSTMSTVSAVDLGLLAGETVAVIESGNFHNCVYTSMARVKCWGSNVHGQLGLGVSDNRGDDPNEMGSNLPAVDFAATSPTEVTNITSSATPTSVTFSWDPPIFSNGTISDYEAWCGKDGSFSGGCNSLSSQRTVTVVNIGPDPVSSGQFIECYIRARTVAGTSGDGMEMRVGKLAGLPLTVTASSHLLSPGDPVPSISASSTDDGVTRANETCSTTYTTSSPVGVYPTTCSGGSAAGYSITYVDGLITVAAPLTVTASSHSLTVGDAIPLIAGSPSVAGVARSGETCSTTYTVSSPVGTYPTTCSGGVRCGVRGDICGRSDHRWCCAN